VIQAYLRRNYVRLIERLLMGHGLVAIATHDPQILRSAPRFIAREGVPRERYEFEMLYGSAAICSARWRVAASQ